MRLIFLSLVVTKHPKWEHSGNTFKIQNVRHTNLDFPLYIYIYTK